MNYAKIYADLIFRAKARKLEGYKERHHIVPRCLGGTDDIENIVDLTAEEHFLAHLLLVKMYPEEHKLLVAVILMTGYTDGHRANNKAYGELRRRYSKQRSELSLGHAVSEETRAKIAAANTGKKHSVETRQKISEVQRGKPGKNKGIKFSEDVRRRMSESKSGRPRTEKELEHLKEMAVGNMGKICSDETKAKISKANSGKKRSDEAKKRMSDARKRYFERMKQEQAEYV